MNLQNDILGSYYGSHFTDAEYQEIGLHCINPKYWKGEAKLYRTKWFDYRGMREVQATYLFANHYRKAYSRLMEMRVGNEIGQYKVGLKGHDVFLIGKAELTGMWRARRMADEMGIPYSFYCNTAIQYCNDFLWKRLPRPTQLYSEKVVEVVREKWEEHSAAYIQIPDDECYLLENYTESYNQDSFQHWLCGEIEKKTYPHMALETYMSLRPMLSEKIALQYFSEEMVKDAISS